MSQRSPRASGIYLNRPLWQRYALAVAVAAVLLAAMVIWVNGHNTDSNPSTNPAAAGRANREAEILIAQDQAPHVTPLPARLTARAGIEHVIHARVAAQVTKGALSGPLERAHCRAAGTRGARHGFSCTVESGSVTYPFLGVVDTAARRVTYCKRDPPPVPSDNVPVSRRCRA